MYPDTQTKRIRISPPIAKKSVKQAKSAYLINTDSDTSPDEDFNYQKPEKVKTPPRPVRSYVHDFDKQKKPTAVSSLPSSPVAPKQTYWPLHSAPRPRSPLKPVLIRPDVYKVKPSAAPSSPPSMEEIQNPSSQSQATQSTATPATPTKGTVLFI